MVAVTFTVPAGATPARVQAELTIMNTGSKTNVAIVLPITNPAATFKNLEPDWEQVPRPGQKPVLARAGDKLTTLDLKVTVAAPDGGRLDPHGTVESVLAQLASMCNLDSENNPIALTWGGFDTSVNVTATGYWHVDTMEVDSVVRQQGTNNISRANVALTLIEASDAPSAAGGGSLPAWTKPPAPPASVSTASPARTWTVASGDTAYSIASAVYGSPEPGWRTILDANAVAVPSSLAVGQTLLIPASPFGG